MVGIWPHLITDRQRRSGTPSSIIRSGICSSENQAPSLLGFPDTTQDADLFLEKEQLPASCARAARSWFPVDRSSKLRRWAAAWPSYSSKMAPSIWTWSSPQMESRTLRMHGSGAWRRRDSPCADIDDIIRSKEAAKRSQGPRIAAPAAFVSGLAKELTMCPCKY